MNEIVENRMFTMLEMTESLENLRRVCLATLHSLTFAGSSGSDIVYFDVST